MASNTRRNVRIAVRAAALALAAGLAWAVAPAISLGPYVPEPVNFEQAVPAAAKLGAGEARSLSEATRPARGADEHGEGRIRFLTPPIEAPKRFDLVGLTSAKRPVELRTRAEGSSWSPWVETNNGEPVWSGGADELQIRSRNRRPRGEIGYVNVSGDADAGARAVNGLRGAVNSAFVSVASIAAPSLASGDAPFEIVNRSEWDPSHSCVPRSPVHGQVRAAVVHHTVNSNDYSAQQAPGVVLAICRYHRYSQGWNDIGYNALVDRFGNVYSGRVGGLTNAIVGAHTAGFNSQTFGVASIGDHRAKGLSKAAIGGLTNLLAWKLSMHGIDGAGKSRVVSGGGAGNKFSSGKRMRTREITRHRRFNYTSCPGRAQIKKIARITREKIASGEFTPPAAPPAGGGISSG